MKMFTLKHIPVQRFILDQNDFICGIQTNHGKIYDTPNDGWNFCHTSLFIIISECTKFCGMEREPVIEMFTLLFSPGVEFVGVDMVWVLHVVIYLYVP
jgi:hypothetical protein